MRMNKFKVRLPKIKESAGGQREEIDSQLGGPSLKDDAGQSKEILEQIQELLK